MLGHHPLAACELPRRRQPLNTPEVVVRDALRSNVLFRRAQRKLAQAELAKRSRVSRAVISAIENGDANATLDVLGRIAAALDTSVVDLLSEHIRPGDTDADLERRSADGPEAYVDSDDFLAAVDDRAGRYSPRGRRRKLSAPAAS